MNAARLFVAAMLSLGLPAAAAGQSAINVQASIGTHLGDGGNSQSIAIGFLPHERWEIVIGAERFHLPTEVTRFGDGMSATRGGTTGFISGEIRFVPLLFNRTSLYVLGSAGGGRSRPNVNELFPDPVTNSVWLVFGGAGVRVKVAGGLSAFADVRAGFQQERDSVYALLPVRGGVVWRF